MNDYYCFRHSVTATWVRLKVSFRDSIPITGVLKKSPISTQPSSKFLAMSCPDCSNGGYLPGEPTGTFSTQGAYFAPAPVAPGTEGPLVSKRAVLLLTDVFGLPLKNSKIVADNLAKRLNCDVWIPDYFEGT